MNFSQYLPMEIAQVLELIRSNGFEAYPVGGCVRDLVMHRTPHDWDITTSATPEQVMNIFKVFRVIETGVHHGTVTIIMGTTPVEITTFRTEQGYSDGRHPDSVCFATTLSEDLSRRDFTMNALYLDEKGEIIDLFGGIVDINQGKICAIGNPIERFSEDSLRILRALRFSARFNFKIEERTQKAMLAKEKEILKISKERVVSELLMLITEPFCGDVLLKYPTIIFTIIPELAPMLGLFQRQDYHCYDVYEHTIRALEEIEPTPNLRLAMLLHDVGKPVCSDGYGHFKGHAEVGAQIAAGILTRLHCSKERIKKVTRLVELHNIELKDDRNYLRRLIATYSPDTLRDILAVARADNSAKRPTAKAAKLEQIDILSRRLEEMLAHTPEISLRTLAITGEELITLGVEKGPGVGALLDSMLDCVINEEVLNENDALLDLAQKEIDKKGS